MRPEEELSGECVPTSAAFPNAPPEGAEVPGRAPLFVERFDYPDGLITNEYATYSEDPLASRSNLWTVSSGSLFALDSTAWTGVPDGKSADRSSKSATGSAVFRLVTRRDDFRDVAVSFRFNVRSLASTPRTPVQDWDGVHLWLRYVSEESLYALTVNRRDHHVVVKKKVPGGSSNGGTYYDLAPPQPWPMTLNHWHHVTGRAQTLPNGDVLLSLTVDDQHLVRVIDDGVGGAPIQRGGKVGIRGDNSDVQFDDFVVVPL